MITVSLVDLEPRANRILNTYLLVPSLLPLGNEHRVSVAVFQQPLVKLLGYRLLLVIQFVNVSAPLMTDLKYRPVYLVSWNVDCGCVLGILHLVAEYQQVVFNVGEACRRGFSFRSMADGWHFRDRVGQVTYVSDE
jgi:hypothetical protein